ncbi:hypothetical protein DH2020_028967 [Rehmannia glutinosa]|uniref:DUF7356 domain-containing protein n=1 Tax=Rehmannia glutinosa TaxID=99300 RepID=A0ABR0VSL9_REHGL
MKLNYTLPVIVLIASVIFSCPVTANSEEGVAGTNNLVLSKINGSNDRVNETVEPVKNGKTSDLGKNDSKEQLESREREIEQKKADGGAQKNELKENEKSNPKSKNEAKEGRLPLVREKCDSSSNRCTDDDKTLVACLRVPGNESPALSLLIQNMGKGSLSITISAPDLVQLEKKQIELQENKDTEPMLEAMPSVPSGKCYSESTLSRLIKVSIRGVESGHFIILTAGHGNCSLNFRDQFVGMKKAGDSNDSSYSYNIFNLTLSKGFLFLVALLLLVVSVFMSTKLGRKYFARKSPKYQKLDMELPVSHGSKLESGENEGWDDSWGDSWDDEEAPMTPSLPVTPSLSSKGIASRKFSKEGWKD